MSRVTSLARIALVGLVASAWCAGPAGAQPDVSSQPGTTSRSPIPPTTSNPGTPSTGQTGPTGAPAGVPPSEKLPTGRNMQREQVSPTPASPMLPSPHTGKQKKMHHPGTGAMTRPSAPSSPD
ncbi:hypothetical protein Gdia_2858 [Gluconacetobacter diazotrophicus PA1 5]|nr:hypothetical protein Gdia_2858 [Gluconacetobacter diazotrophicus PA1 5]TWB03128.1 hypothetical protein FBZ86_12240 [Gluconacetobacter diazotrophicus]